MVVYRLVGRDVWAADGVSNDTVQPVGGVTLRLRLRIGYKPPSTAAPDGWLVCGQD